MFIEFSTENFLSFKERASLSMVASKLKSRNRGFDKGATFEIEGYPLTLLKCAAIYGANASGKSNLFSAMRFMRELVLNSSKESQAEEPTGVQPHLLSVGYSDRPSFFEMAFVAGGRMYTYSFSLDSKCIHTEKLISIVGPKERELFSREGDNIVLDPSFSEGNLLVEKTRKNALFLSVCANFAGKISGKILRWFDRLRLVSGLRDNGLMPFTQSCLDENHKSRDAIDALLKSFDLGIERVRPGKEKALEIPDGSNFSGELRTAVDAIAKYTKAQKIAIRDTNSFHKVFDENGDVAGEIAFDLATSESQGTQKLVALSAPLVDTLTNSLIVFIDEFDARLHPILSRSILRLFNSESGNPKNAQLIIATHDTNLLDRSLLRRDQIWFCEKDRYGGSHLTSLVEYKVRNDASFEKDYIIGKYGAIPILGNLSQIFGSSIVRSSKGKADVGD
ncbi:conserver hypothetical protein [Herbaspirillum rubrisubalbicans M1]|uniref:AAA family ATPase n=1 Tax=Herbaspirillum rubrisubalbicans TaxID=80842 RepID=UPI00073A4B0E|nr:ATP-binding protein [Herbaspirillum rubrisubalbicans]ALU91284.1 conserver hypothetical protein [Herbaspirillum rubrisubalbicans M1]